nr:zinc finger, CCHC-type [Tanacetum cinerariifolium]
MKQTEGFVMLGNEHKVCKLVKSLYGLKQAPKQLHQKFDEVVLLSGFHLNQSDKCVYSKFDDSGKGVIICLYVDDMLIFGTDKNQVDKTKFLSSRFSIKDMGEADVILDCSPVSIPIDPIQKLKLNTGKLVDQLEYSRVVGCLMYDMTSTRPDIAYVVGRLSRGGVISWASKKQTCITSSTMESEFVALAAAGKEAEWLRNLINEILIWPKPIAPISVRCDSAPNMAKAYNQVFNGKSKHLGVTHSMIKKLIMKGILEELLAEGIIPLMSDKDVIRFLKYVPRFREVEVYTETRVSLVERHMMERMEIMGKGVLIEEIMDDKVNHAVGKEFDG